MNFNFWLISSNWVPLRGKNASVFVTGSLEPDPVDQNQQNRLIKRRQRKAEQVSG